MTTQTDESQTQAEKLAQVAAVEDNHYRVVINRGKVHKVRDGQRFLIFGLGKEIQDPVTKEILGRLEMVRGTGKAIHVQEKIATLQSDETGTARRIVRESKGNPLINFFPSSQTETEFEPAPRMPFTNPTVGDFARPI